MSRGPGLGGQVAAEVVAERRTAMRALLRRPLLAAGGDDDEAWRLVRRHGDWLRAWFQEQAGWILHIDGEHARLRKVAADANDATRGASDPRSGQPFTPRHYALWCLALATLERAGRQITLKRLAEDLVAAAASELGGPPLDLQRREHRAQLVAVARLLVDWQVLARVHGDEEGYLAGTGDALYGIRRPVLAHLPCFDAAPSLLAGIDASARPAALQVAVQGEGDEARLRRTRQRLVRRLLDDPVVYLDDLDADERAYLSSQRPHLLRRLEQDTGLVPECRREGIALLDEDGFTGDLDLAGEGTEGHACLLAAEWLADHCRRASGTALPRLALDEFLRVAATGPGRGWRKGVHAAGGIEALAAAVVARLAALCLVRDLGATLVPLPALGRWRALDPPAPSAQQQSLFGGAS